MTGGDPAPTPDDEDTGEVVDPADLDITEDDRVRELEAGRYVVTTDERFPEDAVDPEDGDPSPPATADDDADPVAGVETLLRRRLETEGVAHGFDLTAAFDGELAHRQFYSDDVVDTFEALLMWLTRRIDDEAPPEMVLGILLTEANVDVEYPDARIVQLLDQYDLSPTDSIADLVTAAGDDGTFRL
jgi:hypothetical protein